MTICASRAAAFGEDEQSACSLASNHEIDQLLCSDLEALADRLPSMPPPADLRRLCERLERAAARWQRGDELGALSDCPVAVLCRDLDSVHADDLIEALWVRWRGEPSVSPGQLSYMLRALFDGRRRAIALERLWLGCESCQSSESD